MNDTSRTRSFVSKMPMLSAAALFAAAFLLGAPSAFAYSNLLVNPGAESNSMTGWVVDLNGGNGWSTGWNGPGHSDQRVFSTSYGWDTRHQTVDLVAAGYTTGQLDSGTFDVKMGEWIYTRGDQGGYYFLHFKLLAADGTTVLAEYQRGTMGSPISLSAGVGWFQETHTFTDIPAGTRYVYFGDGGHDQSTWAGNYGTNFDDASVVVSDTPFYDLTYAPGANGTLTGTITQTLSSGSDGTAVTPVPSVGYVFVNWSDVSTASPRTDTNVTQNVTVTANFADVTAPVVSAVAVSGITQTGATVAWTTDEAASSRLSYGPTAAYGTTSSETDTAPRVTSHSVSLSGLGCGTVYHFKVISRDAAGNTSSDNDSAFATSDCPVYAAAVPLWVVEQQSKALHDQEAAAQAPVTVPTATPLPQARPAFEKPLKQGQSGDDVRKLQEFLKSQGPDIYPEGIVSGVFGRRTKNAVARFQEKYAADILAVANVQKGTGIAGEYTLRKINQLIAQGTL